MVGRSFGCFRMLWKLRPRAFWVFTWQMPHLNCQENTDRLTGGACGTCCISTGCTSALLQSGRHHWKFDGGQVRVSRNEVVMVMVMIVVMVLNGDSVR